MGLESLFRITEIEGPYPESSYRVIYVEWGLGGGPLNHFQDFHSEERRRDAKGKSQIDRADFSPNNRFGPRRQVAEGSAGTTSSVVLQVRLGFAFGGRNSDDLGLSR